MHVNGRPLTAYMVELHRVCKHSANNTPGGSAGVQATLQSVTFCCLSDPPTTHTHPYIRSLQLIQSQKEQSVRSPDISDRILDKYVQTFRRSPFLHLQCKHIALLSDTECTASRNKRCCFVSKGSRRQKLQKITELLSADTRPTGRSSNLATC
jgi:hypothetical protein